jgi:hypothetical protein
VSPDYPSDLPAPQKAEFHDGRRDVFEKFVFRKLSVLPLLVAESMARVTESQNACKTRKEIVPQRGSV